MRCLICGHMDVQFAGNGSYPAATSYSPTNLGFERIVIGRSSPSSPLHAVTGSSDVEVDVADPVNHIKVATESGDVGTQCFQAGDLAVFDLADPCLG